VKTRSKKRTKNGRQERQASSAVGQEEEKSNPRPNRAGNVRKHVKEKLYNRTTNGAITR